MREESKKEFEMLMWELDQIDDLNWHSQEDGDEQIPEMERWVHKVGECDSKGNWKYPAELLADTDAEQRRIKRQRELLSQARIIFQHESNLADDAITNYRTKQEKSVVRENIIWAQNFGLSNKEIAFVLGENVNTINVFDRFNREQT